MERYSHLYISPTRYTSAGDPTLVVCHPHEATWWTLFAATGPGDLKPMFNCAWQASLMEILQANSEFDHIPLSLRIAGQEDIPLGRRAVEPGTYVVLPGVQGDNGVFKPVYDGTEDRYAVVLYKDDHTYIILGEHSNHVTAGFACATIIRAQAAAA
jgi:hypothetical protein